jgi:hypothetical protein
MITNLQKKTLVKFFEIKNADWISALELLIDYRSAIVFFHGFWFLLKNPEKLNLKFNSFVFMFNYSRFLNKKSNKELKKKPKQNIIFTPKKEKETIIFAQ